jgi:rhodanese-related sulfurtransferase
MHIKILRAILGMLILGAALTVSGQSPPTVELISQQELRQRMQGQHDMLLIDVRTPGEFSMGHVPGAVNIPHTELAERLGEVPTHHEKRVVLYCESGRRANIAEGILQQAGVDHIRHLEGDMAAWRQSGLPIEK